jgi:uncharacterized membrane protein SpoIIM required for sporulation
MIVQDFISQRSPDWRELESRLGRGVGRSWRRSAAPSEISRFATLFRSACADLARARAAGYPDDLIDYLNSLAAQCHNAFYIAPPARFRRIWPFFTTTFPLTVCRNIRYVIAGLAFFYLPLFATAALAQLDEEVLYQLIPKETLESFEKMHSKGHTEGRGEAVDIVMTGFYVKHNISIAFTCFATGIFVGLGSLFLLVFNGLTIGAVLGFIGQTPSAMNLLSFIAGHGPWELTAIGISGAAGLRLGFGAIITGSRRRGESLRLAGRDAIRLVLGAGAMLVVAAGLEGFFSPSALPPEIKFGVGAVGMLFVTWYLGFWGYWRHRNEREPDRAP